MRVFHLMAAFRAVLLTNGSRRTQFRLPQSRATHVYSAGGGCGRTTPACASVAFSLITKHGPVGVATAAENGQTRKEVPADWAACAA
uniref:Secreted protein n=1 Tax=Macrostomum lignano TaxID=282301 RepID=A0A1I8FAL9_9PLAT